MPITAVGFGGGGVVEVRAFLLCGPHSSQLDDSIETASTQVFGMLRVTKRKHNCHRGDACRGRLGCRLEMKDKIGFQ